MFFSKPHIIFAKNLVITKQVGVFQKVKCDLINNKGGFVFYKLHQGKSCQFDEFVAEVNRNPQQRKELAKLIRWMDAYGTTAGFPPKYYNHIKGVGMDDVYEYKDKQLRIYVKVVSPDVIIILGGYKKNQKLDIENIKHKLPLIDLL